jgi:ABC-type amino acid transport substrate-binding protein
MSTMHMMVLSLLAASAVVGVMKVRWLQLARHVVISLAAVLLLLGGVRLLFESIGGTYHGDELVTERRLLGEFDAAVIHTSAPGAPPSLVESVSRLDSIRERGVLRVNYHAQNLPMTYLNSRDELVGFDVELAYQLARDLGVELEFVPTDVADRKGQLARGEVDLLMTYAVTPDRARDVAYSNPYLEMTLAFVVPDHQRQAFGSRSSIRELDAPVIAVPGSQYYLERIRAYVPKAKVILIPHPSEFFQADPDAFDAMLYPAELGAAWTLMYPEYAVAIPHPDVVRMSVAYAVPRGDPDFLAFLDTWIEFQRTSGRLDRLYRYWILGRDEGLDEPRWSVIRDVLHWVD